MATAPNRTNIPCTSPYEPIIGFSRAVRIGTIVHISGTGPVGAGDLFAAEQTRTVLTLIETARTQAGATFAESSAPACSSPTPKTGKRSAAHGEVFATIRPAATMVVAALLNPKWRVEIEAEAVLS